MQVASLKFCVMLRTLWLISQRVYIFFRMFYYAYQNSNMKELGYSSTVWYVNEKAILINNIKSDDKFKIINLSYQKGCTGIYRIRDE